MTGWQDSFQPQQQYDLSTTQGKNSAILDVFDPQENNASSGWKSSFQPSNQNVNVSQNIRPDISFGRTALDQATQGATFGFGDEITDRLGAGIAHIATGEPYNSLLNEARQDSKQRMSDEFQQHPVVSIGSNLAGSLLTGGAAATTKAGSTFANWINSGNTLARIGKSALASAASGGLYGAGAANEGDRIKGALAGTALGGAVGGAFPAITAAGSALKNAIGLPEASETLKPLAQKALDYGIPLTRTQIGDSKIAKTMASTVNEIPFSGSPAFYAKQQNAFNKAVAATFGEKADKITPEIIDSAYKNIGKKFDQALGGQTIKLSQDHIDMLASIDGAASGSITGDHLKIVQNQLDKLLKDVASDGTISGEKLGSFRSALTSAMNKVRNDASPYLSDLRDLVIDMGTEGSPARRELLDEARSQYKNLKTIEPLAAKAVDGNISPALLQGRVISSFRDYARGGGGTLGDLSRIGQSFIKDSIPNSGTAKRLAAYTALFELPSYIMAGPAGLATGAVKAAGGIGAARSFNAINTSQEAVKRAIEAGEENPRLLNILSGDIAGQIVGHQ